GRSSASRWLSTTASSCSRRRASSNISRRAFLRQRLIPSDLPLAAEVRMWDRFFDNYVSYPQGRLVFMASGREPDDGKGGAAGKSMLETSYALLDRPPHGRSDLGGRGELQPRRLRGSIAGGEPKKYSADGPVISYYSMTRPSCAAFATASVRLSASS